ncbi:mucin-5AC [Scaptodrosophila lebanonensis]|uniref:Mucin-5AC n=1 Tax=Drosophila lebanonensis TaxID=7225 RepID=A0A6J2U3E3_DROLE|nr:mucin-5AC [Scaptodrosophila lebanonensis]XP_030382405.1 mucin-5AC [Scaptodrosophila lebanonensis]
MSSMKGGFSTLNRWFGKKQKDKNGVAGSASNGKLSKSTTQLHHLSTDSGMHINETSQLEYNRITPLPAATSNAPFEQTFRIKVLLPKEQLYVTRLGARVALSKLLAMVCDNKQLDADKYEFRNPVDASQVYSCESTIGAVGLSEIRLCHKSESYDNFNADAMPKFQRTTAVRDSLSSSSDFSSSRHSKLTTKTPSPYSSSNSLNSMDSTGMNYTRTPVVLPKTLSSMSVGMAPPPRKKRPAPRPPSQLVIPEQTVLTEIDSNRMTQPEPAYAVIVKRPQMCASTPNLSTELDCNGNNAKTPDVVDSNHYETLEVRRDPSNGLPEPTPRKRLVQVKKKAAPAPPPDASVDTVSLASTTASISDTLTNETTSTPPMGPPQPAPRITTPVPTTTSAPTSTPTAQKLVEKQATTPPPLPSSAAPILSNQSPSSSPIPNSNNKSNNNSHVNNVSNVSKVLLNRTPTPEPRSMSSAADEDDNDAASSKQADSGIGEPVPSPSPLPDSLPSEAELKSTFESSSDDDEAIKVYNFKLCKTSIKAEQPVQSEPHATTLAELSVLTANDEDSLPSGQNTPAVNGTLPTPSSEQTSLTSWNYAVPISPPPDFSDQLELKPRPTLQLESPAMEIARPKSATGSPLDEIVDELSTIINEQRLDSLIRKQPTNTEIEAAKPNKLANFSIACIATSPTTPTRQVARADSFQASKSSHGDSNGLGLRSSSHLSLTKIEQNGLSQHQRRSSSELSIGESPSLQSLEVIKTILSSRKNSLEQSSGSISPTSTKTTINQTVTQPQIPKSSPISAPSPTINLIPNSTPSQVQDSTKAAATVSAPAPATSPIATSYAVDIVPTPISPVATTSVISEPSEPAKQPLPQTYRYSGPPSINFATWSERPKSQVAIKNEGDYIFGGKQATNAAQRQSLANHIERRSNSPGPVTAPVPVPIDNPGTPVKLTIETAAPTLRMGIPRKEYKVPITVKPLRDVSVDNDSTSPSLESSSEPASSQVQLTSHSSTLPRPAKSNRFTLPASMGHLDIGSTTSNSLPRPTSTVEPTTAPAPFGQNTLRRTGFKERMLAKEQQEKEQALRVRVEVNGVNGINGSTTSTPSSLTPPQPAAKPATLPKTVINSSRLELKLKQATPPSPTPTPTPTPETPALLQVKLRSTARSAAPAAANTPAPPPPPMAPAVQLKSASRSVSVTTLTPTSPDPRSQLLDAIRNFKREELNRA